MIVTGESITDEQLAELMRSGCFYARVALERRHPVTLHTRLDARARSAAVWNSHQAVRP